MCASVPLLSLLSLHVMFNSRALWFSLYLLTKTPQRRHGGTSRDPIQYKSCVFFRLTPHNLPVNTALHRWAIHSMRNVFFWPIYSQWDTADTTSHPSCKRKPPLLNGLVQLYKIVPSGVFSGQGLAPWKQLLTGWTKQLEHLHNFLETNCPATNELFFSLECWICLIFVETLLERLISGIVSKKKYSNLLFLCY